MQESLEVLTTDTDNSCETAETTNEALQTEIDSVYKDIVLARAGGLRAVKPGLRTTRYRQGV